MHDELGASLTRIALMSEIAADEPEMQGDAARQLGEIAQAARSVSGTLDQIVWTVNPAGPKTAAHSLIFPGFPVATTMTGTRSIRTVSASRRGRG